MDKLGPWFERTLRVFGRFWLPFSLLSFVFLAATVVSSFLVCVPLIIGGPLSVGLSRASFAALRGESPTLEHLMSGFKQFGASFVAMLVFLLASWLPMVLVGGGASAFVFGVAAWMEQHRDNSQPIAPIIVILGFVVFAVLVLLIIVFNWWLTIRVIFTFAIIADHPETRGVDAIKQCWALTSGRAGVLFVYFFALYFLATMGMFACYVGMIFTIALLPIGIAVAYADLTGMNTQEDDLHTYMPPGVTPS